MAPVTSIQFQELSIKEALEESFSKGIIHHHPDVVIKIDRRKLKIHYMAWRCWYADRGKEYNDLADDRFRQFIIKLLVAYQDDMLDHIEDNKPGTRAYDRLVKLFRDITNDEWQCKQFAYDCTPGRDLLTPLPQQQQSRRSKFKFAPPEEYERLQREFKANREALDKDKDDDVEKDKPF